MTTNYNIIACDGGGIRGLITAMLLNDLVSNPPQGFTANTILNNVNLFAGTSTGAIIAIGLASGLTPSTVVHLYGNDCSSIFQPYKPSGTSSALSQLHLPQISFDPCSYVPDFCYVRYSNEGLYNLLSSTLKANNVNPANALSTLSTNVLAVTLMMSNTNNIPWAPLALTNLPDSDYADVAIIDAAMCSSAAPLYFPPYAVPQPNNATMWCADGGVVANNPSAFTLANVLQSQILQNQKKELSNVRMLSIGTGATIDYVPSNLLNNSVNDWGMLMWLFPLAVPPEPVFPLMAAMFDGQAQIAHIETGNILGNSQYQRANPTLTKTINLDDCSAVTALGNVATNYIQSNDWVTMKKWAYDNFI